ncbi:hypothetical protein J6590_085262 [Homalodisca vitripennis]|nr:hypothetical protein J6590_085262 [Homalodisca vitripennis]
MKPQTKVDQLDLEISTTTWVLLGGTKVDINRLQLLHRMFNNVILTSLPLISR